MSHSITRSVQFRQSLPKLLTTAFFSLSLLAVTPVSWSQDGEAAVKKTESGICHDATSRHYERVKSFKPYPSMQACLDDGGRKPKK